jgi:L-threonylcarbamoyladenylate synthase
MTEVLALDPQQPDPAGIARAAAVLRAGGLVAFPTETVYGLGAHAMDPDAVRRIFAAKQRPAEDPLIVHVHDASLVGQLAAAVPPIVDVLAARFWPGPLTIVLRRASAVPLEVTAGLDTVAVRIPAHPIARALINAAGVPVAAPSANLFSRPSPTRAAHVLEDLDGRIDMVIDGGATTVGVESTVIDLTTSPPGILRPGAITLEMIRGLLPDVCLRPSRTDESHSGGMKSPGLLSRHYSPRAALTLYEGLASEVVARMSADAAEAVARGSRVGIIIADEDAAPSPSDSLRVIQLGRERDYDALAANLYHALRSLDAAEVDLILIRHFGDSSGLSTAIHDRLTRAAAGRIVRVP